MRKLDIKRKLFFSEEADLSIETARENKEVTKPSLLMKSINVFISELTELFKDGISGLFRDAKEDDGDEEDDLLDEDEDSEDDEKTKDKKGKLKNIEGINNVTNITVIN